MEDQDKRRAAEALKDLIVEEKRSRWPMVMGLTALVILAGGAAYWFYLPPEKRPSTEEIVTRLRSGVHSVLNTPVLPATKDPASPASQKPGTPPPAKDSGGLISN